MLFCYHAISVNSILHSSLQVILADRVLLSFHWLKITFWHFIMETLMVISLAWWYKFITKNLKIKAIMLADHQMKTDLLSSRSLRAEFSKFSFPLAITDEESKYKSNQYRGFCSPYLCQLYEKYLNLVFS